MASGSAFHYSTLATLGHPSLLCLSPPLLLLLVLQHPRSLSPSRARASSFAFSLPLSTSPSAFPSPPCGSLSPGPDRCPLSTPRSHPSRTEAPASSFGLRVLLFRSSAFLSFRSLAGSEPTDFPPYGDTADESILRTLSNASSFLSSLSSCSPTSFTDFPCLLRGSLDLTLTFRLSPEIKSLSRKIFYKFHVASEKPDAENP